MSRKSIIAGNWKMNKSLKEGLQLTKAIVDKTKKTKTTNIILATPYTHLYAVSALVKDKANIKLAAQNCHEEESGAYTGEVSASMLKSVGVDYVILGHSERRAYAGEDSKLLAKKIDRVLAARMRVIFCCGESLTIRESKKHVSFVSTQLRSALFHLSAKAFSKIVIAYEPIWAIGTGVTASAEQVQQMHAKIRKLIEKKYGEKTADNTSILYGGSVKPANAQELFARMDVDGALVGGASLKAKDFVDIIESI